MPTHDDDDGPHGYSFHHDDDSRDDPVDADLAEPAHSVDFIQCPRCKKYCHEDSVACPRCKHYLMEGEKNKTPAWFLITVLMVLLLILFFWVYEPWGHRL